MMNRRWAWVAGAVLVAGGVVAYLLGPGEPAGEGGEAAWLDMPASTVAFETLSGRTESLADYEGRVVLLNFWGTWCPPCRREIPELVEVRERFRAEDVAVIGVAVESGSAEEIREFLAEFDADYPIWISSGAKALSNFDAAGYPYTLLVDRDGRIRKQYLGPQSSERLAEDIRALL